MIRYEYLQADHTHWKIAPYSTQVGADLRWDCNYQYNNDDDHHHHHHNNDNHHHDHQHSIERFPAVLALTGDSLRSSYLRYDIIVIIVVIVIIDIIVIVDIIDIIFIIFIIVIIVISVITVIIMFNLIASLFS